MKKIYYYLMASLLVLLASCQSPAKESSHQTMEGKIDTEKVSVVLDWTPNTNHTGLYVAKELGYFAQEGLDVDIIQPTEDSAELLVASGKADFGISFQDTLANSFAKKMPLISIAAITAHNTSGILTLSSKGVHSPKQLEHLRYATWDLPIEQAMIKQIIKDDNGNPELLQMIPSTVLDSVSALQTDIDAIWVFEGWDGKAVEQAGLQTDYLEFRALNPVFDYYTPVFITNTNLLDTNKEKVSKFVNALSKAYQYTIDHPEQSASILLKYAPELDEKLVQKSQEYLTSVYKDKDTPWGYIDEKRWSAFYDWLNDNHVVDEKIDSHKGFTNEFINR